MQQNLGQTNLLINQPFSYPKSDKISEYTLSSHWYTKGYVLEKYNISTNTIFGSVQTEPSKTFGQVYSFVDSVFHIMSNTINFQTAIRLSLLIQCIFMVSSIWQKHSRFILAWQLTCYTYLMLTLYIANCIIILSMQTSDMFGIYQANGNLWSILFVVIFFMAKLSMIIMVIALERKKCTERDFLESVCKVDTELEAKFDVVVDCSMMRNVNTAAHTIQLTYFFCLMIVSIRKLSRGSLYSFYYIFAHSFIYIFENIAFNAFLAKYLNSAIVLKARFGILQNIFTNINDSMGRCSVIENRRQLNNVFDLYFQMTHLLELFNEFIGWGVLSKIAHDFILCSAISYLVFTIIIEQSQSVFTLIGMQWWFLISFHRILLITIVSHQTMKKVSCKQINKNSNIILYLSSQVFSCKKALNSVQSSLPENCSQV